MSSGAGGARTTNCGAFSHATANTQEVARLDIAMNGFWGGRTER